MGGCVSSKAPANPDGPPQRAGPSETKDVRTTRRGPGGSVDTPTTPQCRTDASSMPSPAIATTPPWGFTPDGEPNGRIRTVQPRRRRQPPGAVPSSSVSPSALQTRTYSDTVKRVAVKPSLSQVTKTLAWKVAASTSGKWAARVEVVGRSEANIRLSLTEQVDRDKAVFSVHFPASFPEVPCIVSYKGPRFDSPLDVELALGFPHHPQLRPDTWTRYTDLADLILSSVIPTLDAYHPLPEPTVDVLEWNNVETRLIGLMHPHMQQQGGDGGLGVKDSGLRGVFVGLRRLLDEMEADGGSMERLVHFNVLDWTDGLLGRVGDMFVPACDYDDARSTLNRLVKVLAMAHEECHDDDAHIEGLRTRVSDVTKRWAVRRRAMSKSKKGAAAGPNAAAEDLWTFILETAKLKYAKDVRVERSVTVDDGNDGASATTDALDTFINGAREQHLLSGPYWSALALAYQLISNEQAAIASITIPSDRVHDVMRKGFESLFKKPTDNVLNEDDAENEEEDDGSAAAGGVDVRSALRDELKLVLEARKAGANQPSNAARKADSHKHGQRTTSSSFKFVSNTTMAFMDTRVATKGDIPSDETLVMALLLTPPAYRSSLEYDDEGTVPIWQVKRPSDKTISYALPLGVVHTSSSSNKKEEKAGTEPAQ